MPTWSAASQTAAYAVPPRWRLVLTEGFVLELYGVQLAGRSTVRATVLAKRAARSAVNPHWTRSERVASAGWATSGMRASGRSCTFTGLGLKQLPLLLGYAYQVTSRCGWNRTTKVRLMRPASSKERSGCGGASCTRDLRRMKPMSYCCSTPRRPRRDSFSNWTQSSESHGAREASSPKGSEPARRK